MNTKVAIDSIRRLMNIKLDIPAPARQKSAQVVPLKKTIKLAAQNMLNANGEPNLQAMLTEIASLREDVGIMSDYVSLKDQYNALKSRLAQVEAGFSKMQKDVLDTIKLME